MSSRIRVALFIVQHKRDLQNECWKDDNEYLCRNYQCSQRESVSESESESVDANVPKSMAPPTNNCSQLPDESRSRTDGVLLVSKQHFSLASHSDADDGLKPGRTGGRSVGSSVAALAIWWRIV